jgi:hypothetical protein
LMWLTESNTTLTLISISSLLVMKTGNFIHFGLEWEQVKEWENESLKNVRLTEKFSDSQE